MKRSIVLAAGVALLAPFGASAQTTDQLVKGATDTSNVLNYGMGYNLQRFVLMIVARLAHGFPVSPLWPQQAPDKSWFSGRGSKRCPASELELLHPVVLPLGQRDSIVEPQRTERRGPDQPDADGTAD